MEKHKPSGDVYGVIISAIAFMICAGGIVKYWGTDHTKFYFVLGMIGAGIEVIEQGIRLYQRRRNESKKT